MCKALLTYLAVCGLVVCVMSFDYAPADEVIGLQQVKSPLQDEGRVFFQTGNTLNTSFAFTVPLFSITLPRLFGANTAPATNLGGLLFLLAIGGFLVIVLPILGILGTGRSLEDSIFSHGLVGISETVMNFVDNSLDNLPKLPRLDARECIKRSICEAHQYPEKYGTLGSGVQMFFPPYKSDDKLAKSTFAKYRLAARHGKSSETECSYQYNNCMVPMLDLLNSFVNRIFGYAQ